jgi:hypothetical protein
VDSEVCGTLAELEEASAGTKVDWSGLSTVGLPTDVEEDSGWSGADFRWVSSAEAEASQVWRLEEGRCSTASARRRRSGA